MTYDEAIHDLLFTAGTAVQSEAVEHTAPVKTTNLREDITVTMGHDKRSVHIGNTKLIEYAKYVYYGTSPHIIRAKNKPALKTPYGPFKKVKHPGTKPNKYLDNALERLVSGGRLERILSKHSDNFSEAVFEDIIGNLMHIKPE